MKPFSYHFYLLVSCLFITACSSQQPPSQKPINNISHKTPLPPIAKPIAKSFTPELKMEQLLVEKGIEVQPPIETKNTLENLYRHFDEWQNVKYRYGGMSKQGIDCSGFAKITFAELFEIELPRSTTEQAQIGSDIDKEELKTGDLVFFRINKRVQHVGIYLEDQKFVHASTSSGVMISNMNDNYWRRRFWKSTRVETLNDDLGKQASLATQGAQRN